MEKQLEFPFMREDNILSNKFCNRCYYADHDYGICIITGEEISGDHTCEYWRNEDSDPQEKL